MSHRGRSLARRNEGRERDWESDEGGCAKEMVKGPFGHVATGARRGRRMCRHGGEEWDFGERGKEPAAVAVIPRDYDFRSRLRQRCAIPVDVIAFTKH